MLKLLIIAEEPVDIVDNGFRTDAELPAGEYLLPRHFEAISLQRL